MTGLSPNNTGTKQRGHHKAYRQVCERKGECSVTFESSRNQVKLVLHLTFENSKFLLQVALWTRMTF